MSAPISAHRAGFSAALLASLLALWLYGLRVLDPASVHWLFHGDPAQHLLGAATFISEPWHWPPGLIAGGPGGAPTSIVFTDAIPLLALAAKLLGWPAHWQYFGLWMLACHALAAWWGCRLLARIGVDPAAACVGGLLFAMAPAMLLRAYGHEALMAHWLLLAALCLCLDSWRLRAWWLLAAVAVLTHAYLAAMVMSLWLAKGASARAWKALLAGLLVLAVIAWLAGYGVGGRQLSAGGFGFFSANLLTWFDPMDWADFLRFHGRDTAHTGEWSALLPALAQATRGQYEGFAYMGAGMLALMLLALLSLLPARGRSASSRIFQSDGQTSHAPHHVPPWLWVLCIAMALFALSTRPSIASWIVVEIPLPEMLERIAGVFRSSGRFIWPLGYLLMAVVIARVVQCSGRWALPLLLSALLLQAVDLRPKLFEFHQRFAHGQQQLAAPATDPAWSRMFSACPRLQVLGGGADSNAGASAGAIADPSAQLAVVMRALALGVSVQTVAASARPGNESSASTPLLPAGHVWRGDTVYLVAMDEDRLHMLMQDLPGAMQLHRIDGYRVMHGAQCAAYSVGWAWAR